MSLELVEGWTAPFELVLKRNGVPIIFTSTGHTPTMILKDRTGTLVDSTGNLAWLLASCGAVTFTPDATDFVAARSPFLARVRVSAGPASSDVTFVPNGAADPWTIYAP